MHLDVILQGKLSEYLDEEYKKSADAVTKGIINATDGLKNAMRSQVKSSGLSSRLANTWRGQVYPKGKKSISAAGVVYSKAPKIMAGFEYQTIIRGKNGFWLAIPTDAIPKRALGKKMTPEIYEKIRNTKLRFVYRAHSASLLVHERKKKSVIAFWLVPQVKMPKLIHFANEGAKWQSKLPSLILQNWKEDD
ncbi:MAG: hypothetical protein J6K65_01760 [Alphaproteobacteria bacterium]|nr:hypothetical protein [Alphaproteobacteria bacterium]